MRKIFGLFSLLGLVEDPLAQTYHASPDPNTPILVEPSPEAKKSYVMNSYLSQDFFKLSDFITNEHNKIQLRMHRKADLGTFDEEYGESLAIDGKGPLDKTNTPLFLHYNSNQSERDGRDAWGKPSTVCSVVVFAAQWKKRCIETLKARYPKKSPAEITENCTLQIGDLSLPHSNVNKDGRCALGHKTHFRGTCVDVRPLSPNELVRGAVTPKSNPAVDRLTNEAIQYGSSIGVINPIWQEKDHFDHFHICFPESPTLPLLPKNATAKQKLNYDRQLFKL